jgi:hypothetical protein
MMMVSRVLARAGDLKVTFAVFVSTSAPSSCAVGIADARFVDDVGEVGIGITDPNNLLMFILDLGHSLGTCCFSILIRATDGA